MLEAESAPKKPNLKRGFLIGGIVLAWILAAMLVIYINRSREVILFSSPTDSRDLFSFTDESRLGILEKADQDIDDAFPAEPEMAVPVRIPGNAGDFVLNWKGEKITTEQTQTDPWSPNLVGDDKIELAAFATWIPKPEDDFLDPTWQATLTIRDAKTLEEWPEGKLAELGIPADFTKIKPTQGRYRTPKIRLIFKSTNLEYLQILQDHTSGADARTKAAITYNLDNLGNNDPSARAAGEWLRYDSAMLLWHDTSLKFHVTFLTGEPQFAEISRTAGSQALFGKELRVQYLDSIVGSVGDETGFDNFNPSPKADAAEVKQLRYINKTYNYEEDVPTGLWIKVEKPDPGNSQLAHPLIRYSSSDYMAHLGWIGDDGQPMWEWSNRLDKGQFRAATASRVASKTGPLKLVFLPKRTELTFEIAGLPDMPNPSTIENLFDVKIPRMTLSNDPEQAEDELLGLLSVAAQVGWDYSNVWDDNPPPNDDLPADYTLYDMSPNEILNWYLSITPSAHIRYEEADKVIFINEETEGFWARVGVWFDEFRMKIGIF